MTKSTPSSETVLRHRGRYDQNFTIIHNDVANGVDRLSYRAIGIALHLWFLPDGARIDSEHLAFKGKEGRDAVRTAFSELITAGFMLRTRERLPSGQWRTVIELADRPVFAGRTDDGKPGVGEPGVGEPGGKDLKDFDFKDFDSSTEDTHTSAASFENPTKPEPPAADVPWAWLRGEPSLSPALKAIVEGLPISDVDLGRVYTTNPELHARIPAELGAAIGEEYHDRQPVLCLREIPGWPADDVRDLALVGEVTAAVGSRWLLPGLVDRFLEWGEDDPAVLRPRGLRTRFRRHAVDVPAHVVDELEEDPDVCGWLEARRGVCATSA